MKKEKINRTQALKVRLTPNEMEMLLEKRSRTTCNSISEYARNLLLGKRITYYFRNQNLDNYLEEIKVLTKELNLCGINYNQTVKRLHSLQNFEEIKEWLLINESNKKIVIKKIEEINIKISEINVEQDCWAKEKNSKWEE